MASKQEFKKLKEEIISIVNELPNVFDIEEMKLYFVNCITSKRSLWKVKTLQGIFDLLETRDIIHPNEVNALQHFGIHFKMEKISTLVTEYTKLYVVNKTCLCGENSFTSEIFEQRMKNSEAYFQEALLNLSENIGFKWRTLASELDIPEYHIDNIREEYPSDSIQQAKAALRIWKELNGKKATLEELKKALEARLCKRDGINIHMLEPTVMLENKTFKKTAYS